MMKVLVCTETRHGKLDPVSMEMLSAARSIAGESGEVTALVIADRQDTVTNQLGAADRAIAFIHPDLAIVTAEVYSRIALEVVEAQGLDVAICAYSAIGLDVAPDLSARTARPLVAYVIALEMEGTNLVARSQIYGGKIFATTEVPIPAILMVSPGSFPEAQAKAIAAGAVTTQDAAPSLANRKVSLVKEDIPDLADIDLATAERIVCVGRGIGDQAGIERVRELAILLDAEIAGSRPVVDSGWLPKLRQVGKSGRRVKPKLYLALGVSGAPEHIEGMSRSDLIVAVNTDAKAPIFGVAHYGATCDLFDFVASLCERLHRARTT